MKLSIQGKEVREKPHQSKREDNKCKNKVSELGHLKTHIKSRKVPSDFNRIRAGLF
jgi:hypothetical protein